MNMPRNWSEMENNTFGDDRANTNLKDDRKCRPISPGAGIFSTQI
jgi:hypothetical protein